MGIVLRLVIAKRAAFSALALLLACGTPYCASQQPRIASLSAIASMSEDACQRPLVSVEGVVTHARPVAPGDFFLQQDDAALYVENPTQIVVNAATRVRVIGSVNCGLHPSIHASSVQILGPARLPAPLPVTFTQLMSGRYDAMLVSMRTSVRSADPAPTSGGSQRGAILRMMSDSGPVDAMLHVSDAATLEPYLDADVEVTGIAGVRQDSKQQRIGVVLYVGSLANVRILRRAATDPWSLPATRMDTIMSAYAIRSLIRRVRVHGTVTYVEPGRTLVLQEGTRSLLVNTESRTPVKVGDEADAIGFPIVNDSFMVLTRAEIRPNGLEHQVAPEQLSWRAIFSGRHAYDLITLEGHIVHAMPGTTEDSYVLATDGKLFGAILRHQPTQSGTPPWPRSENKILPVAAQVRVTGVCFPIDSYNQNGGDLSFNVMLRTPADIVLLKDPSPINTRNLGILTVILLLILVVLSAHYWHTERRVRREMARLAYSERRRSRILEQINGSVVLAEIVEQTTELVSFRLQGVPCWVHIAGGAVLGNQPKKLAGFRVVQASIPSRTGQPSGTIYAAIDQLMPPSPAEKEALTMASGLIELAMETRKTYTDLVHRSEFDLLTNVQNRFSLERSLDQQIHNARASAGIFGLIYIDLNNFKLVNDLYGHQAGDRYLQHVALRMKRQLRPGDLLARLGGDEFAILVPEVHSRAEAEEITLRLKHCFDEPFDNGDSTIPGSASIGLAIYPEDGRSREALLSAADAAMYEMKHSRPHSDAPSANDIAPDKIA